MRSLTLALALLFATPALAQNATHDAKGPWRTVVTDHYRLHYPVAAEVWALEIAEQLDGIRDRVSEEVGFAPDHRVDIVVMDPFRDSNGFAIPFLRRPRMGVFATPPGASSALGNYRTWAEDLVVHEDAHLVHMMRPTRGPVRRALQSVVGMGPVSTNSPAWVVEGYATVVEGRLTMRGRPNSDFRATLLRSLAQEGRLPTYEGLNGSERWGSRGFRYLIGSAFLEWLEAREHDGALRDLWARMTARTKRKFEASFEGVFGDDPRALYGEFVAELTRDAMAIEQARTAQAGSRYLDLSGSTGTPALSPDGTQLAAVVSSSDGPRRLRVWSTDPNDEASEKWDEAIAELVENDPEDVPADKPEFFKPEELHVRARNDRGVSAPRWTPDGQLLFASWTANGRGWARPDLYLWNPETGNERRITRGANVIEADVHPDGERAFAVQTDWGVQQLIEVDLDSGDWTPLTEASTDVLDAPRVHPDGESMVYLRNAGDGWELVLRTLVSGDERVVPTPKDAIASDPAWTADGTLLVSLARDGFIELAALDLDSGEPRLLTATRGGAFAPTAGADEVFFLTMDAVGRDIHRIALPGGQSEDGVAAAASEAPAELPEPAEEAIETAGETAETAAEAIVATIATEPLATLMAVDIVDPTTFAPVAGKPTGPVGIMLSAQFGEVLLIDQKEVAL
ncbi:MAG: hypothetical protein KC912_19480 [Proteobacteria bacterium]|nr:hypothetical protein [Pseudomonadota bacterium]